MSKVVLYFRRWKNYSRQKNLDEDWAFAKKFTEFPDNNDENEKSNELSDLEIFQVKFLGSTTVDAPKSEKVTANAIKSIITTAKGSNKKLQRLNLSVCPKGIETFDAISGETLHRISIYKISYCSADAAHSNVFAFIAGSNDANGRDKFKSADDLVCYAFLCTKRRIAYNLTVTVAKNFERAFDLWKQSSHMLTAQRHEIETKPLTNSNVDKRKEKSDPFSDLIDFDANSMRKSIENQKQLLQTTWVSFTDENICESSDDNLIF